MSFREFLDEELKDPEFRAEFERVFDEEDARLREAMAAPDYYPAAYTSWDGRVRQWKYADEERPQGVCYDCRRPYATIGDCSLSNEVWERVNPTYHRGAGLLCANCIIERLHALGIGGVEAKLW